jgi:hypothetical protein
MKLGVALAARVAKGTAYLCQRTSMRVRLSRVLILASAVLILETAATASARPKKRATEHPATVTTMCYGTPVIVQGFDCPKRPARVEGQEHATKRAERPRVSVRGSSAYVAPLPPRTPSLMLPQPSVAPYIPPPINNPSERIMQYNQSFPLNSGLGNNPTGRDAYIRYNLNR